ncbi:hypothetical protein BHM03_00062810 [Ensete ventricosum]|uniref:Uncharacterized protein n=1 Tax=Ensete ventricosum TaxID=4639 RepID=A0A445MMX3_ENSVE|nr:hypothetical protein BHM03_00062810 [Ensete ventricosum]
MRRLPLHAGSCPYDRHCSRGWHLHECRLLVGWQLAVAPCERPTTGRPYGLAAADRAHGRPPAGYCLYGRQPLWVGPGNIQPPPCRGPLLGKEKNRRGRPELQPINHSLPSYL